MLKYYLYVSDAKVEMLYAQIPKGVRDQIVGELKIDLKILAVSLQKAPNDETRYSKLQVVCDYLDREGIGSVDQPAPYFRGSLPMTWGQYSYPYGNQPTTTAFFAGRAGDALIGLGGSARYLIVNAGVAEVGEGGSSGTPMLMAFLASTSALEDDEGEHDFGSDWWTNDIAWYSDYARMPPEPLEFLARRLKAVEVDGTRVLLGTPVYVASAE